MKDEHGHSYFCSIPYTTLDGEEVQEASTPQVLI